MDPSDYVTNEKLTLTIDAVRSQIDARFEKARLESRTEAVIQLLAIAGLMLAFMAFGNQAFTSGANLSETTRNNSIAIEQLTRAIEVKDAQIEQQSQDIQALVRAIELQAEQGEDEQ